MKIQPVIYTYPAKYIEYQNTTIYRQLVQFCAKFATLIYLCCGASIHPKICRKANSRKNESSCLFKINMSPPTYVDQCFQFCPEWPPVSSIEPIDGTWENDTKSINRGYTVLIRRI